MPGVILYTAYSRSAYHDPTAGPLEPEDGPARYGTPADLQ